MIPRMRTLVIGGTLFIGREIVQRLARRGHDVTVLHRRERHDLGPAIRNIKADRSDLTAISRVLREGRYDAVFDLAYDWEKGTTAEQVEAAARSCGDRLQRYVFMSSVAAYGPGSRAPRERSAGAGRLSRSVRAAQGRQRACAVPTACGAPAYP